MMLPVKYFTNDEVAEMLSVPECIELIDDLFKNIEHTQMPPKIYMDIPNGDFRAMPAIVRNTAGIKWCGVHLDETGTKRKVNIFAKILINDVDSGKLLAILDGETLTEIRTAAVTGIATKYLSHKHAKKAAFIGCGNQTPRQIQAVLSVRDIKVIKLFDLSKERANKLKDDLNYLQVRQTEPVIIEVHDNLEDCLWDSDIVTTLTPSRKPFIKYRYLKPVVHINAVGADAKGKRELHQCVLENVDLVSFDEWVQCSHSGEIQYAKKSKISQIWCPISEIIQGKVKTDGCNTTLFDATGLAIEDVATARYIYEKFNRAQ
jgi:ornithine cyclodeaminase/alanine dehydrogenase-like protein (mu-crystallin family)